MKAPPLPLLLLLPLLTVTLAREAPPDIECSRNADCPADMACRSNRCANPCRAVRPCGKGALCSVKQRLAVCSCREGEVGDPFVSCAPHSFGNMCDGACGFNAKCVIEDRRPVCSCPENTRGDRFEYCHVKKA